MLNVNISKKNFWKMFFKSIFYILLVLEAQAIEYRPKQVTRSDSYPFAVLIISYPLRNAHEESYGSGTVINIRWVLTKARLLRDREANLAVVGAGVSTFSSKLNDIMINPVNKTVLKEGYNSKAETVDDVGLVKTQRLIGVPAIIPYWLPANQEQDVLTNVYWVLQGESFNKFELSWIPHSSNEQFCLMDDDPAKFCLTTTTDLGKLTTLNIGLNFPCTRFVKSIGGPIIGNNRLQGIYMGISDNLGGDGCVAKKGSKLAHWGIRFLHVIEQDHRIEKRLDDWIGSHVNEDYGEPVPHIYKYATDRISTTQKGISKATNKPVHIEELGVLESVNYSHPKPCRLNKDEKFSSHHCLIFIACFISIYLKNL